MKPLFAIALAFLLGCDGPTEILDVVYDNRYGDATSMDVYLPADGRPARPAVMLIHGGAWRAGDKDNYTRAAKRLAEAGYVAATINYRLAPEHKYPAQVQDCVCALSFLRANAAEYGLDPQRIAVMGYSAGGHLSSLLGTATAIADHQPDCDVGGTGPPAAAIPGAGRHDLRDDGADRIADFLGGKPSEIPAVYAQASPITHVSADDPPYLLIHGGGDWFVDPDESRAMRDALLAQGVDARLLIIEGGGHLVNPSPDPARVDLGIADATAESWLVIIDFLDRTVGPP